MGYEFDADTAVERISDGVYAADIRERWNVGDKPNGGYLLAIAVRAAAQQLRHPDPLSVTGHYLRAPEPGPVTLHVETVREGRAISTASVSLRQHGREVVRVLGSFRLTDDGGADSHYFAPPPELPPVSEGVPGSSRGPGGMHVAIVDRFDYRFDPATIGWAMGRPSGNATIRGWIRFADGRDVDPTALTVIVDAMPPPVFDLGAAGWVPTLELTLHVRQRPAPGWLKMVASTRFITGSDLEEDVEVWDSTDRLVAQARQIARLTAPLPANG